MLRTTITILIHKLPLLYVFFLPLRTHIFINFRVELFWKLFIFNDKQKTSWNWCLTQHIIFSSDLTKLYCGWTKKLAEVK